MDALADIPSLREAIERSADPDDVATQLRQVVEEHPEVADEIRDDELVRSALVAVASASRSLTHRIRADLSMLAPLRDRVGLAQEWDQEHYRAALGAVVGSAGGDPRTVLRRWKHRELLRIAVRDLLGMAELPAVGRELAALAGACLDAALELAAPEVPMAIVGMGKLGGAELNYASDVDVLFVHEDGGRAAAEAAERAARAVLSIMAEPSAEGIVFRTDANLRPEGRSGALSRDLPAYVAYWERWADAWEFQALLKARPVAGAPELGAAFAAEADRFVWREELDPDAVRAIRAMKARSESELRRRGVGERELKRGPGGIRDVEFAVQLLQLVHGRHDEGIRAKGTLDALEALARHGYVDPDETRSLDAAYRLLRTVEHRLQLVDEQQVHALPTDEARRTRLARVLGYRDRGNESALDLFHRELGRHQALVRSIHERLFFRPLLEAFAGAGPLSPEAVEARLTAFGFRDAAQIRGALRELTVGFRRQSRLMEQMFPLLLEWLSESPDPDLGLLQLRTLSEGPARSANLARAFRESAGGAARLCHLLGSSRVVGQALRRNPDLVASLADDEYLETDKSRDGYGETARQALAWRGDAEAHREGIRRLKRRELVRVACRDLLGFAEVETVGRELAALADSTVDAALRALEPSVPFAVIGMGRLGGNGLSYASDVDVLFVFDGNAPGDFEVAERTALSLIREVGATTAEGELFEIDARLRPEGSKGAMARSLDSYRRYYERWVETWELQALTKARFVAGDPILGHRFLALVDPFVYRDSFPDAAVREIRTMKARIEAERIPPTENPEFHLKLGPGALSDVEFTVQLLKLRHGGTRPELRGTETVGSIERLVGAGVLAGDDGQALVEAYRFCERARNYRFLHTGRAADALPSDPDAAAHLARMLGYTERPLVSLREDYKRLTRRCRRVVERVFYGKDG